MLHRSRSLSVPARKSRSATVSVLGSTRHRAGSVLWPTSMRRSDSQPEFASNSHAEFVACLKLGSSDINWQLIKTHSPPRSRAIARSRSCLTLDADVVLW
jgi:hypothetical protein